METITLTMGQAIVKFLNEQYISVDGEEKLFVDGIFTIFGHGNVLGLGQALQQDAGKLKVYQGRNEQGMAHVATAFAKQHNTHTIMACTTSIGPGAANMVTAAATATANNIPLLLFPGDIHASRQSDPVLQQIEQPYDPTLSTNDAFRPVCRYWDRITRPEQIMSALLNAMRVLLDESNRGAVCIALPQDVQAEAYAYPIDFFKKRVYSLKRTKSPQDSLEEAIILLKQKQHPLIICGGGVKYSLAHEALATFSEHFKIPIVETQAGKGAVVDAFAYQLGGIGVTGNAAANQMAKQTDCVLALGTKLSDFTTGSNTLFENKNVDFIAVNTSSFHAMKQDAIALVGDVKTVLQQLQTGLGEHCFRKNDVLAKQLKAVWSKEYERLANISYDECLLPEVREGAATIHEFYKKQQGALVQTEVIAYINAHSDDHDIVVGASGSLPGCMQRMWKCKGRDTYHMEYGYSCMGYEVAAGLGVKLANDTVEVYVMVGDGSYQMLHSELVTSLQLDKKINILLFDNGGFGCINNLQMGNGIPSYHTEFRDAKKEFMFIDYAKSASGYGVKTYRVHTMQELAQAFEDSKKASVSTLIDIKVLPKTMSNNYDCWWNVGIAQQSDSKAVQAAANKKNIMFAKARKY